MMLFCSGFSHYIDTLKVVSIIHLIMLILLVSGMCIIIVYVCYEKVCLDVKECLVSIHYNM